ncbi:MAG: LysM peptidoglycan-binding domain-containing protein, partial [Anaerolineae bacterium]|nr:LysM peptidoglycan-binding domain-containing protein [Anaerolineae bacterium]
MSTRRIQLSLDESLARRLAARAVDLEQASPSPGEVAGDDALVALAERELQAWLGRWGLRYVTHLVRPRETLQSIAARYYGVRSTGREPGPSSLPEADLERKAAVIAAFNALSPGRPIQVGQLLRIPEAGPLEPLPKGESPYLFGLHDRGGEHYMGWAGRKGWVLITEALGRDPDNRTGRSYRDLADAGYGVIVRLNHGYGERGTLPRSEHYESFAERCGRFVHASEGCHIWIVGNEMNLAVERPGGPEHGEWITPALYARAFAMVRQAIRSLPGHEDDQVVTGAVGPWNVQTSYPGNPSGDWIVYFRDMLAALDGELDGVALHTYGRSPDPAEIVSELRMDPPFEQRRKMFRTYIDFMQAIPAALRHLPVYITETDQNV